MFDRSNLSIILKTKINSLFLKVHVILLFVLKKKLEMFLTNQYIKKCNGEDKAPNVLFLL